jgi:succinate dehydrogenase / fumarate reductase cytochrome b subunit
VNVLVFVSLSVPIEALRDQNDQYFPMSIDNTPQGIKNARPLSPHLQIYDKQITSVLSILHRFTGVILSFGTVFQIYWLSAAAYGPDAFARAQGFMGSWFGQLMLLGMIFSLYFHLANGIRHLFWDAGLGFELPILRTTGKLVVAFSVIATALSAVVAYSSAGNM